LLAIAVDATPAMAHTGHPMHGLTDGALHPFLGVDHLVAMVTVGILAVTLRRPLAVPTAFVSAMVLGGAAGIAGFGVPLGEVAMALSIVALGGALAASHAIKHDVALAMVAIAGVVHGHAHGAEAPAAARPVFYVLGFVVATVALHAAGVALGYGVRDRLTTRMLIGSVVAGLGTGLVVGLV
jgi:urease accessory protein